MTLKTLTLALSLLAASASTAVFAQTPTPTPGQHDTNINQRRNTQQDRIGNGISSGQMTSGEASRIENQEHGIHQEEHGMRAQDGGHLTGQDRRTLHHQQNQESRRIYRTKHNANVR